MVEAQHHRIGSQVLLLHIKSGPKLKHTHIKLEQRLRESIYFCLWVADLCKKKKERKFNSEPCRESIQDSWSSPLFVQAHCQGGSLKALFGATKSGLQLLSTSVLPFPSFLLLLSLSLVITVRVQLRCLPWEPSQRCVTAMWCFTRLVTKPPDAIHTCGINKFVFRHTPRRNRWKEAQKHTTIWSYSSTTCGHITSPSGLFFIWPDTTRTSSSFSCYPGTVSMDF